jgi:hypothetical protein
MDRGADFIVRHALPELIEGMQALAVAAGGPPVDVAAVEHAVRDRDAQLRNVTGKDPQLAVARDARRILSERIVRVARPAPLLDPADGPLIAVRLNILTRKSLGGLETDLEARVLDAHGRPIPGLYAAGEVAGFGGGGMHGYRALEGTFLGGCLFSGRIAGRAAGRAAGR